MVAGENDRQTEEKILEAAHAVFLRRGTFGARTQDIAEEAGVNKALLHYYFRTKEKLAKAVFERAFSQFIPGHVAILNSEATIEKKVEGIISGYLDFMGKNPYLPGYVISEINHHPERLKQVIASMQPVPFDKTKLAAQLDARAEAGTLRPIPMEQFVVNLFSLCALPFVARPMLEVMLGMDDAGFAAFLEERRRHLPVFFLDALRP